MLNFFDSSELMTHDYFDVWIQFRNFTTMQCHLYDGATNLKAGWEPKELQSHQMIFDRALNILEEL